MIQYHLSRGVDGRTSLTVFDPNDGTITIADDNPAFGLATRVVQGEVHQYLTDEEVIEKFREWTDVIAAVKDRVLNADVKIQDGKVYLSDGNPVDAVIEQKILEAVGKNDELTYTGLAAFLRSLNLNPSQSSREQLYSWLDQYGCEILPTGEFLAYKGVRADLTSQWAGFAVVDGEELNGNVPNKVGSVIEFPREEVDDDPNRGCSVGLHVANESFAQGYGSVLLKVAVAPEDVVSVPLDSSTQKIRVCKYRVYAYANEHDVT